ncbi:hypothetical protein HispidOSU_006944, partial [Sigmodon hispidus]
DYNSQKPPELNTADTLRTTNPRILLCNNYQYPPVLQILATSRTSIPRILQNYKSHNPPGEEIPA